MDWRNRFFIFRCRTILVLAICIFAMCYYFRDYKPNHYMRTPIFFNDLVEPDANRTEVHQPSRKLNFLEKDQVLKEDDYAHSQNQLDRSETYEIRYSSEHDVNEVKERRLPQAIICGVKKGGTRALLEMLRLHPDVVAAGKEVHFFDSNYDLGLDWYRKQMPPSFQTQLTVEKTPKYFITSGVPERIYSMSQDVLFLVVVRDPVTRALSDFTQTSIKHHREMKTFEEMAFLNSTSGLVNTNWIVIKIGLYAKHFDRWLSYFPRSKFHFVSGERLVTHPQDELLDVQKFLGLRPIIDSNYFSFSKRKGFPCLKKFPRSNFAQCLDQSKGRSHPRISPSDERTLRDFYRPFNKKFYDMVGKDFGWS